ncbi:hypothetical protein C2G38_2101289 [Gigaspora rosea]|uniref:Uncharacterized protein n=1 Tax=Gigaspora rosea TaxID=44941 RepID=A0A397USH1_9GLOM|nr:hypothetical protein C2G38_2101289 [Gigaspora rosea]
MMCLGLLLDHFFIITFNIISNCWVEIWFKLIDFFFMIISSLLAFAKFILKYKDIKIFFIVKKFKVII